jgi:hypothetical protein
MFPQIRSVTIGRPRSHNNTSCPACARRLPGKLRRCIHSWQVRNPSFLRRRRAPASYPSYIDYARDIRRRYTFACSQEYQLLLPCSFLHKNIESRKTSPQTGLPSDKGMALKVCFRIRSGGSFSKEDNLSSAAALSHTPGDLLFHLLHLLHRSAIGGQVGELLVVPGKRFSLQGVDYAELDHLL